MTEPGDETKHRYPWHHLRGDYVRAAAGLALCVWLLTLAIGTVWPFLIIAAPTAAFAVFGIRTWVRHTTLLTVTPDAVVGRPAGAIALPWHTFELPWSDLNRVKLNYYSTRRDKTDGWMQMTLATPSRKWNCDSGIEGFERLANLAFNAGRRNAVAMNDTTMSNFLAMGIATGETSAGWGDPATWRSGSETGAR